jgi:hypothetical protein
MLFKDREVVMMQRLGRDEYNRLEILHSLIGDFYKAKDIVELSGILDNLNGMPKVLEGAETVNRLKLGWKWYIKGKELADKLSKIKQLVSDFQVAMLYS